MAGGGAVGRIMAIMRKEFIHIRRDPRTLAIVLILPIFQLVMFGYAVTSDVKHLPMAVLDYDRTPASRALAEAYRTSLYFDLDFYVENDRELARLIDSSQARVGVIIPPGYATSLARRERAAVSLIIDGSDPTVANTALASAAGIGQAHGATIVEHELQQGSMTLAALPGVEVQTRVWYNPNMISANYMVPALVGLILQTMTALLTALAIAREREQGTLEGLIITPIRAPELMIGKIIPYILVAFTAMIEILVVGTLWFKVPINGSVLLLVALADLFLLSTLGIGLLVSTVARTQQEAMMLAFFTILPSVFLSGFMFPIVAMPAPLQWASKLIPLTYFLIIDRGIVLKGNSLEILYPQAIALAVFGAGILTLAVARFRKRLE
ncbi:MAG: ABC transporter permease [Anaerolineae bacterium]